METGMLWFDDSAGSLSDRVRRAAEYYAQKFGRAPTLCLVNPSMLDKDAALAGVQVRGARTVMPNHFFIGEERNGRNSGNGHSSGNGRSNGKGRAKAASNGGSAGKGRAKAASRKARDGSA